MELKYSFAILIATVVAVQANNYMKEKPSFMASCKINQVNFQKCLASNFQVIFSEWKDGVPGLESLGPLDPLIVKRIKFIQDSGIVALNMDMKNVIVTGASQAIVADSILDTKNWHINVTFSVPTLSYNSDYKVKGHVLALNLNSIGRTYFRTDKNLMTIHIVLKLRDYNNVTFSEIESAKVTIHRIGGFYIKVDNLFNGQKELEDAANALFNENWRDLYEALLPAIEQTVTKIIEDRLQKIFHYVPASYFIEDIPKAAEVYG